MFSGPGGTIARAPKVVSEVLSRFAFRRIKNSAPLLLLPIRPWAPLSSFPPSLPSTAFLFAHPICLSSRLSRTIVRLRRDTFGIFSVSMNNPWSLMLFLISLPICFFLRRVGPPFGFVAWSHARTREWGENHCCTRHTHLMIIVIFL